MGDIHAWYEERGQLIGKLLHERRIARELSISKCAEVVGTTRRRYAALESGKATIGLLEAQVLANFLEIPVDTLWPMEVSSSDGARTVPVRRGDVIQLVIL